MVRSSLTLSINIYDASEALMDTEMPAMFCFKLAMLLEELRAERMAFAQAVQKLKKENGKIDEKALSELCDTKVELKADKIKKTEMIEAFDKLPLKAMMAMMPILEDD